MGGPCISHSSNGPAVPYPLSFHNFPLFSLFKIFIVPKIIRAEVKKRKCALNLARFLAFLFLGGGGNYKALTLLKKSNDKNYQKKNCPLRSTGDGGGSVWPLDHLLDVFP